jgi:hypothetical protein
MIGRSCKAKGRYIVMELLWAIARIEYRCAEEAGVCYTPAQFEGHEQEHLWLEIYLDSDVTDGDVVTVPIVGELSMRPLNALFREGAKFKVGFGDSNQEPDAHGEIVSVRRSPSTPSDRSFHEILQACQQPTTAVLENALSARHDLTRWQADHINYLAGFTHFAEAESLLTKFGMDLEISPSGLPYLYDRERQTRHVRVLLNDLTHQVTGLAPVIVAEAYQSPILRNEIKCREPQSGTYVTDFAPNGRDREAYFHWMNSLEMGIGELVTSFSTPDIMFAEDSCALRTVIHAAHIPARNTVENLSRLFANMGIVLTCYSAESRFNLSFERLLEEVEIRPSLERALWVLIETHTEDMDIAIEAVNEIGAQYIAALPPNLQLGLTGPTGRIGKDYIGQAATLIRERLQ